LIGGIKLFFSKKLEKLYDWFVYNEEEVERVVSLIFIAVILLLSFFGAACFVLVIQGRLVLG